MTYSDGDIRFNVAISDDAVVVARFELFNDEQWHEDVDDDELGNLPNSVKWHRVYSDFVSDENVDDTIATLVKCGFSYNPKMFMWYMSDQLAFAIRDDNTVYVEPIPAKCHFASLFLKDDGILPEDLAVSDLPFGTDLRDYMIFDFPAILGDNCMENVFEFSDNATKDTIISELTSTGFTYDPEL
jgi:hypothetical protein